MSNRTLATVALVAYTAFAVFLNTTAPYHDSWKQLAREAHSNGQATAPQPLEVPRPPRKPVKFGGTNA